MLALYLCLHCICACIVFVLALYLCLLCFSFLLMLTLYLHCVCACIALVFIIMEDKLIPRVGQKPLSHVEVDGQHYYTR